MKGRCCATCKHAAIHYTPKGRLTKDAVARCEFIISEEILKFVPASVMNSHSSPFRDVKSIRQSYMDPKEDRSDCPVYEEGQPRKR